MAKIDPKTAKKMYSATNQASKDKIAKERYGEFGFDTLKYEEQERVYKNNPGLQRGEGDKSTDFKGPLDMLKPKSPFQFKGANSSNSKCWPGYKKVGTKPSPSGTGETVNDCKKK
jgi:hypothetical protein|eukprot:SAG31_NODE_2834_length_5019_cov_92.432982_2_plen_115_part_00